MRVHDNSNAQLRLSSNAQALGWLDIFSLICRNRPHQISWVLLQERNTQFTGGPLCHQWHLCILPGTHIQKVKIYVASNNCESLELNLHPFIQSSAGSSASPISQTWVSRLSMAAVGDEAVLRRARFSSCASFSADVVSHCSMQNPGVSAGMTTSAWVFSKCCSALFTSPFVNQRPSKEVAHETLSLVHRCLMEYVGVNAPVSWICWRCSLHRLE